MESLKTHLVFDSIIGQTKPITIVKSDHECPFCCRDRLEGIIAEEGPILLIVNKYPVLRDTFQTVLVETEDCHSELSLYPKDHLHKVVRFGMEQWLAMMDSGQYQSVLFYKNHGPCSGGTIRHPHMQIVGLKNINYMQNMSFDSFHGKVIHHEKGVELNLASKPRIGFFEYNIKLENLAHIDRMADYIQIVAHYILNHFHKSCNSYNLFFYYINREIWVKIMPRFVTSPLFLGYSIPQISSRADEVIQEIQNLYF